MGASIAELYLAQGRQLADARRRRGDLIGNTVATLAQVPGDIYAQRLQEKAQQVAAERQQTQDARIQKQDERADVTFENETEDRKMQIAQREAAQVAAQGYQPELATATVDSWIKRGIVPPEEGAQLHEQIKTQEGRKLWFDNIAQIKPVEPKAPEPFTLSPGQTRFNPDGTQQANVPVTPPEPKEEKTYTVTVKGPNGRPLKKVFTESELKQGVEEYQEPTAAKEPSKFWVFRDGAPVRISEAEYRQGDLPSNTREQGRPVTSGDAGAIADFDTSLDDLGVLKTAVTGNDATGILAWAGAKLPNAVTNITGIGVEAKVRQAVIDRVKQVIGKTLEGGVLRKEDEYKYEKILPTIGDPPEVVAAKLAGLEAAITKRRQTKLDALSDAGYEIGAFTARAPHGQGAPLRQEIPGHPGKFATSTDGGKTWKAE